MFALPELPYPETALAPVVTARTLQFHHGKHHAAYVKNLNNLLGADAAARSLEAVIRDAESAGAAKIFNNAAQCWNHSFYWLSMTGTPGQPTPDLAAAITAAYGDHAAFKAAFIAEGVGHFGSGWLWLVADAAGTLSLKSTHDAHAILGDAGTTPLLVCDLWEHAYYLDHQNDRAAYLAAWLDTLADWGFAAAQYAAARAGAAGWQHPLPAA